MSAKYDYDLVVIGAGSGGLAAAKRAVSLGKRVAIAEKEAFGGTCVNRGCIPTKLMVYAAEFAQQRAIARDYGWLNLQGTFDWPSFKQSMDKHLDSLQEQATNSLEGADIFRGQAQFIDAHGLQIEAQKITAEFVLLAVGGRPKMPDISGIEHAIDSRGIIALQQLPKSLIVVGGGYIGVELAQVLHSLGCHITLVESNAFVLDGFDCDLQKRVKQVLTDDGVTMINGARLKAIEPRGQGFMATLSEGQTLEADQILCALGRTANTDTLNLEATAVSTEKGMIVVDPHGRTKESNIFAAGDCTATMLLTPVAKAEGIAAVEAMFSDSATIDYTWVPSAVFTHPEVATAGLSEQAAQEQYDNSDNFEVYRSCFRPLKYAIATPSLEAFIKLVVDASTQKIVGVHMVAPRAGDLVQALLPALKKGLTVPELQQTIGIHPSTGEEIFSI